MGMAQALKFKGHVSGNFSKLLFLSFVPHKKCLLHCKIRYGAVRGPYAVLEGQRRIIYLFHMCCISVDKNGLVLLHLKFVGFHQ